MTATQNGDDEWARALAVTTTTRIGRGRQSIAVEPILGLAFSDIATIAASSESGLPVELQATGACSIENGTLVPAGAGACTITATQAGDEDWSAAEPVARTIQIRRGPQAIELDALPTLRVGGSAQLAARSSAGLPVSIVS